MKCKNKRSYNRQKCRSVSVLFSLTAACCLSACGAARTAMKEIPETETEAELITELQTETESETETAALDFEQLQTDLKLLHLQYGEDFTFAWNIPAAFSPGPSGTKSGLESGSASTESGTGSESETPDPSEPEDGSESETSDSSETEVGSESETSDFSGNGSVTESKTETESPAETDFVPVTLRTLKDYRELRIFPLPSLPLTIRTLETKLTNLTESYSGLWSVYVKNLTTGDSLIINDVPMKSASVMKLFIMGTVYEAIDSGELDRTQEVVDLLNNMICYSSNTDSNRLLSLLGKGDYAVGIEKVNQYITTQNYSAKTHEYNGFNDSSIILDSEHFNQVSAKDCGNLLEQIYRRTFGSRKVCNEIETMMLKQDTRYKIPAGLPEGTEVGNKTGEMDTVENDVAVIYGDKSDYILCVLSSDWDNKNEAISHIEEISSVTYDFFDDETYYLTVSENPESVTEDTSEIKSLYRR